MVQLHHTIFSVGPAPSLHSWFWTYDPKRERHKWRAWVAAREKAAGEYVDPVGYRDPEGTQKTGKMRTISYGSVRNYWYEEPEVSNERDEKGRSPVVSREWRGEEARRILAVLERPERYPYGYRFWPGPNCVTYTCWVLKEAGIPFDPHPIGYGKDWTGGWVGAAVTPTGTGVQVETPVVGLKLGLRDGVELHIVYTTWGIDLWPPALKTPGGRLGFPE